MDRSSKHDTDDLSDDLPMAVVFANTYARVYQNLPAYVDTSLRRDEKLIKRIVKHGVLPRIAWNSVKREYERHLSQLTGRDRFKVIFLDVGRKDEDAPFLEVDSMDVDVTMEQQFAQGIVVHGKNMVYAATLAPEICAELYERIENKLFRSPVTGFDYSVDITDEVYEGIQAGFAWKGSTPDEEYPPFSSYGYTPRKRKDALLESKKWQLKTCWALGSPALVTVGNVCPDTHSPQSAVAALYHSDFLPYLRKEQPRLASRFSGDLRTRHKYYISSPLLNSMPVACGPGENSSKVKAACAESQFRSISEYLCLLCFGPLPYSSSGLIASQNLRNACDEFKRKFGCELPWRPFVRPFPKGSFGLHKHTPLHDDANGCIIPGIWTSISGGDDVFLNLIGHRMNIKVRGSAKRFCWFMGWIPHQTVSASGEKSSPDGMRVHHSAYSNVEIEHVCLQMFSPEHLEDTMSSVSVEIPNYVDSTGSIPVFRGREERPTHASPSILLGGSGNVSISPEAELASSVLLDLGRHGHDPGSSRFLPTRGASKRANTPGNGARLLRSGKRLKEY